MSHHQFNQQLHITTKCLMTCGLRNSYQFVTSILVVLTTSMLYDEGYLMRFGTHKTIRFLLCNRLLTFNAICHWCNRSYFYTRLCSRDFMALYYKKLCLYIVYKVNGISLESKLPRSQCIRLILDLNHLRGILIPNTDS